jgi:hypothetical protein
MVATTWAVGVPLAAGILFLSLAAPHNPPLYLSGLLTAAASLAAGALGARYQRNFSDLLLWNWFARIHAERRLATGTRLLDFDELLHADRPDWAGELRPRHDLRILTKLASALERKDLYTLGHSRRVARQACRIAAELSLGERELEELAEAAALHDIGKIRVPDAVLTKNGALTIEELAAVQEHPEVGARLVSALGRTQLTAAVLHHHESWDGRGYPKGLGGEDIPLFARIIAVADAYDAMTSDRPYRRGMSHGRAMEILKEESGRQFDPRVIAAFERCQQRNVVVPALIPLVFSGRRLLRAAFSTGSAAASPAAAAVTATAMVLGSGFAGVPTPPIRPAPAMEVAEVERTKTEPAGRPESLRAPLPTRDHTGKRVQAPAPLRSRTAALTAHPTRPAPAGAPPQPPGEPDGASTTPAPEGEQVASVEEPAEAPEKEGPPVDKPKAETPPPDRPEDPEEPVDGDGKGTRPAGDPQPDKGKDCDRRTGRGRGKDKHCPWL